jgi:phosphoribosylformylglycinamidine cyclo-ligase
MATMNYAQAGVDRDAADRLVEKIQLISKATLNRRVKSSVGGYASLFELDKKRWLAASTDGVGTKLKLAFRLGDHRTVGIDLVAMSVNDLLCVGAEPLFFLDYFATGKLKNHVAEQVLSGIAEGCRQARCALVGGETAEMPEFYSEGEYDLAGFAVGVVAPKEALPVKSIRAGDALIGIASSGAHSNGFSLLRKLLPNDSTADARARELLTPTRIYCSAVAPLLKERGLVKGLAHITGSGFLNVPRISDQVDYEIHLPRLEERAPIFKWVNERSGLPLVELAQTFNLGIGMVVLVPQSKADAVLKKLKRAGETAWLLGQTTKKKKSSDPVRVQVTDGSESATLSY